MWSMGSSFHRSPWDWGPLGRSLPGGCRAESACRIFFFFSSRRRHTRSDRDWSSDVCSSDLEGQTSRRIAPVRCAYSTVLQLHRYFEDVVLENNLNALVVESLPLSTTRTARERARIRELAQGDRRTFLFAHQADGLNELVKSLHVMSEAAPVFIPDGEEARGNEHFIVIADARFSALLATVRGRGKNKRIGGDEVIWTFETDIVYLGLEYLMGRGSA